MRFILDREPGRALAHDVTKESIPLFPVLWLQLSLSFQFLRCSSLLFQILELKDAIIPLFPVLALQLSLSFQF